MPELPTPEFTPKSSLAGKQAALLRKGLDLVSSLMRDPTPHAARGYRIDFERTSVTLCYDLSDAYPNARLIDADCEDPQHVYLFTDTEQFLDVDTQSGEVVVSPLFPGGDQRDLSGLALDALLKARDMKSPQSPASGENRWVRHLPSGAGPITHMVNYWCEYGDKIFCVVAGQSVYSLDERDGHILWRFTAAGSIPSEPVIYDPILKEYVPSVFFGTTDGSFYWLDARTGIPLWRTVLPGEITGWTDYRCGIIASTRYSGKCP